MTLSVLNSAFDSSGNVGAGGLGINLQDNLVTAASNYSQGATNVTTIPGGPSFVAPWTIFGYTISFSLFLQALTAIPNFGRLGKLYGGLVKGSQTYARPQATPWTTPMQILPSDLTLLTKLWDGDTDPTPPFLGATGTPVSVPIAVPNQLAQPLYIHSGENLYMGLWYTPALAQNVRFIVAGTTYSISYDDGSPAK